MNLFKFVVVNNAKSVGLFPVVCDGGYFAEWSSNAETIVPCFGSSPLLFRYSHAKFMVRELRRAGFYVSMKPYIGVMIKDALANARKDDRKAEKDLWHK